ncbi:hypothetical protein [Spiroplasma endosymbiont of Colias croceus]|uniref:hypothetical protein n=1 Tax=Spiroplasma endosymbiont of Colias croceus TaxID=3066310 RepID=UPI0030CC8445
MYKNIIKIDKKSDINKKWPNFNNKIKSYKLVLKNKEYNLFFAYGEIIKLNNIELDISEIQKYGGWGLALKGLVREHWLRDIENKTEEEILKDKEKLFKKGINGKK